jgi:Flp pilus assembly pilin Flp
MQAWWQRTWQALREDNGQDLAEYCMLLALVVLIAAGIFVKVSGGLQSVWTVANSTLNNTAASTSVTSTSSH